ncbi:MAG: hypothetical protein Q8L53_16735 [Aestuariivirga sp.]|nr:hypothetical protein [Aestuariivirga sp.]
MKLYRPLAAFAALAMAAGLAYAAPANFSEGFNNLPAAHWMRGRDKLTTPFGARDFTWFDDFFKYTAGDWVVTEINDSTQAMGDANGGTLVLTTLTAEDDAAHLQSVGEIFTVLAGKQMYFESRFKIGDATQSDFVMGLHIRDTTPLATSAGVYFQKDDGDALLDFHSMSASVDTATTGIHTVVDDTFLKVSWFYDGISTFTYAVDDVVLGSLTATPSTTEMTVSFGVQAGSAAADVMTIDYIYVWRER